MQIDRPGSRVHGLSGANGKAGTPNIAIGTDCGGVIRGGEKASIVRRDIGINQNAATCLKCQVPAVAASIVRDDVIADRDVIIRLQNDGGSTAEDGDNRGCGNRDSRGWRVGEQVVNTA